MSRLNLGLNLGEVDFQSLFYGLFFEDDEIGTKLKIDRSTDGYTEGILFEHKQNIKAYGQDKALSQALIYLSRFNADGIPVPGRIMLVCQDTKKVFEYKTEDFAEYINAVHKYAGLQASKGIEGFKTTIKPFRTYDFDLHNAKVNRALLDEIESTPKFCKVDITVHNVYGWANYYYTHATEHKQKPRKDNFFEEIAEPVGTLEPYINAWTGDLQDFKLIMDLLNDPMTQKKLGCFYTPEPYCELAYKLVQKAIARVPEGNDYVIIDRCAGTGNLENVLSDEELSHVIINTYELKEWYVLKDRLGNRVRAIIPPIPKNADDLPDRNEEGFLSGANALTKEFYDKLEEIIETTKQADNVTRIVYENPPYVENNGGDAGKKGMTSKGWKDEYVVSEMKKSVSGSALNDMANAFIWSAFNLVMKEPTDSYIVFSPIKYWKSQNLVFKKPLDAYMLNREHFHAKIPACISCILWSNEDDENEQMTLKAYDINDNGTAQFVGDYTTTKVHTLLSDTLYEKRELKGTADGIVGEQNGKETVKPSSKWRVPSIYNQSHIGYLVANGAGFDNPDFNVSLTRIAPYGGNGCYIYNDNFVEKLPLFAAGQYYGATRSWLVRSFTMKSGDKADKYIEDCKNGTLDSFLTKCLIWTALTQTNHCRSLMGSDNRLYKNELCLDKDTLASKQLQSFIDNGYVLTAQEQEIINDYKAILNRIKTEDTFKYKADTKQGYNPKFTYGLYQIDEEVNYKIQVGTKKDGKPDMKPLDGDLNNEIKSLKAKVKKYYLDEVAPTLFEYELLK